jgi:small-conductance mechanosensitive channel
MRASIIVFAVVLSALAALAPAAPAAAQGGVTILLNRDDPPDVIRRAIEAARAAGPDVTVRFAETPGASPPAATPGDRSLAALVEQFMEGVRRGNDYMALAPSLVRDFGARWSENRNGGGGALGRVLAALALALGVGALVRSAGLVIVRRRIAGTEADLPGRLAWSARILLVDVAALAAVVLAARWAIAWLLPEPDLARALTQNLVGGAMIFFAYLIASDVLLGDGPAGRPLLPLPRPGMHRRYVIAYAAFGGGIVTLVNLAPSFASDPRAIGGAFAFLGAVITAMKIVWFWHGRRDFAALVEAGGAESKAPSFGRRVMAVSAAPLLILSAIVIWAVGRIAAVVPDGARWAGAAGVTQIVVVLLPIIAGGSVALVRALRLRRGSAVEVTPLAAALAASFERAVGAAVWIAGIVYLGRLWSDFFIDGDSAASLALLRAFVSFAVVVVVGWLAWAFLVALFDAYAPPKGTSAADAEHDEEQPVATRLGTVLPVLRGVALGAVVGLTLLVALTRLGVEIGPLLAGFGILGLALSFGSQALVRDIVSGIFFMAEDAFRVGEYVDTGRLKGTVEKISIRSVQLRHQSGQIHTVPFGQITAVTNASRDWATVKFNLRLEHGADIEVARKTVKKVGAAMMEDPELAAEIIQPLKMQGVAEIADNAVVIRLKFTAKPAKASWLQREATKRVYRALREAGVAFASNALTVRSGADLIPGRAAAGEAAPG